MKVLRRTVEPLEIRHQREKGWTDFHPETFCHRCGSRNIKAWFTSSEMWNEVVDAAEILCPQCFTEAYEERHPFIVWALLPEMALNEVERLLTLDDPDLGVDGLKALALLNSLLPRKTKEASK